MLHRLNKYIYQMFQIYWKDVSFSITYEKNIKKDTKSECGTMLTQPWHIRHRIKYEKNKKGSFTLWKRENTSKRMKISDVKKTKTIRNHCSILKINVCHYTNFCNKITWEKNFFTYVYLMHEKIINLFYIFKSIG